MLKTTPRINLLYILQLKEKLLQHQFKGCSTLYTFFPTYLYDVFPFSFTPRPITKTSCEKKTF